MPSTEALPGGGGRGSHAARLNFKISCVGVSQNLMSPLEIERKSSVFVGILQKVGRGVL